MIFVPQAYEAPAAACWDVEPGYMWYGDAADHAACIDATGAFANGDLAFADGKLYCGEELGNFATELGAYDCDPSAFAAVEQPALFPAANSQTAAVPKKALAIRNPKTGEAIKQALNADAAAWAPEPASWAPEGAWHSNWEEQLPAEPPQAEPRPKAPEPPPANAALAEALPKVASEEEEEAKRKKLANARKALLEPRNLPSILLAASRRRGCTAAKVATKRGEGAIWCGDRSVFTALNIDGVARPMAPSKGGDSQLVTFTPPPRPAEHRPAVGTHKGGEEANGSDQGYRESAVEGRSLPAGSHCEVRRQLLALRCSAQHESRQVPPELQGLGCAPRSDRAVPSRVPRASPKASPKLQCVIATPPPTPKIQALPMPSPTAYRPALPGAPKSKPEELRRTVQALLNKVCPESVVAIAERLSEVEVTCAEELELLISAIFQKALGEPHYCETYADLAFELQAAFPQFPDPAGGKPVTFRAALLNICQQEFEALPQSLDDDDEELPPEELESRRQRRKARVLANMKFIGHLFLRQLLSAKVVSIVIPELVLCDDADMLPQEHVLECACELILNIGHTLESLPAGAAALTQVCRRLQDLRQRQTASGRPAYSKRLQFMVQDLLETRAAGWTRKTFRSAAKTKEEIRLEQHRDLTAQAQGVETERGEQVVAGLRPTCLSRGDSTRAM